MSDKDEETNAAPEDEPSTERRVSKRTFLSQSGRVVLLAASYEVISIFSAGAPARAASCGKACTSGCTSGATVVYPDRCQSCTACTSGCTSGCTKYCTSCQVSCTGGCTKVCTSGCCISCTKSTR
jgi:hypothetical protein